jgi:hypothetical protein
MFTVTDQPTTVPFPADVPHVPVVPAPPPVHEQEEHPVSPDDATLLASFESKFRLLKDRVIGCLENFYPGLFAVGAGGCGKSHTIMGVVKAHQQTQQRPVVLMNSHVTSAGLWRVLKTHRDATILVEDAESLTDGRDRKAWGLLRSALEGVPGNDGRLHRIVTWGTNKPESVEFLGSLIIVANRDLPACPEVAALETRIPIIRLKFEPKETAAKMRSIAAAGYDFPPHHLSPADCLEVADLVLRRSNELGQEPNVRVMIQSFRDRLQWSLGASECSWAELVESRIRKSAEAIPEPANGRSMRKGEEVRLLQEIRHLPSPEQVEVWIKRTGKSRASYFRRLKETSFVA